ncbi:hypothetical protein QBC39DRAFT_34156 [Podospora conica]|nr:hypothetical protein QBC39DRAFT_34156 [Schizothecium conicum]
MSGRARLRGPEIHQPRNSSTPTPGPLLLPAAATSPLPSPRHGPAGRQLAASSTTISNASGARYTDSALSTPKLSMVGLPPSAVKVKRCCVKKETRSSTPKQATRFSKSPLLCHFPSTAQTPHRRRVRHPDETPPPTCPGQCEYIPFHPALRKTEQKGARGMYRVWKPWRRSSPWTLVKLSRANIDGQVVAWGWSAGAWVKKVSDGHV